MAMLVAVALPGPAALPLPTTHRRHPRGLQAPAKNQAETRRNRQIKLSDQRAPPLPIFQNNQHQRYERPLMPRAGSAGLARPMGAPSFR